MRLGRPDSTQETPSKLLPTRAKGSWAQGEGGGELQQDASKALTHLALLIEALMTPAPGTNPAAVPVAPPPLTIFVSLGVRSATFARLLAVGRFVGFRLPIAVHPPLLRGLQMVRQSRLTSQHRCTERRSTPSHSPPHQRLHRQRGHDDVEIGQILRARAERQPKEQATFAAALREQEAVFIAATASPYLRLAAWCEDRASSRRSGGA